MKVSCQESVYWLHDLSPFIIKFSDDWGIRWYGFAYVLGFVAAAVLLSIYFKRGRSPFNKDQSGTIMMILIIGTMVGGRLGYMLLYEAATMISAPWKIIQVWKGGMASHGGIAGLAVSGWYVAHRFKQPFWKVSDIVVTLGPAGVFFGRIANFINGELWGTSTTVPWAIVFPDASPYGVPRHPSQLYEAALEGLMMLIYLQLKFWKSGVIQNRPGQLTGEFFVLYAILRIFGEQFREPDADPILGLSRGSFYSILMILIGVAFIIRSSKARQSNEKA
ncbi:MAG: prolipoprotein diacylglyceryl transferase [Opitutaceae bacterium]|nr:prolipoprotein diacylglyceryl transferase [Opitutaceae bacterium]